MAEGKGGEESDDKPYEATQKKLLDARKKGNVPRSNDLNTTAAYAGLAIALLIWGKDMLLHFGGVLGYFLSNRLWEVATRADQASGASILRPAWDAFRMLLPMFLLPALFVLLSLAVQRNFIIHGGNIQPKLSRISPLENFKKKFGRRGLFEFFKSFVKMSLFSGALIWFMASRRDQILSLQMLEARQGIVVLLQISLRFLLIALANSAVIGVLDYLFQRAEHLRNLRMSHREMRDELKESEGDPAVKQKRRQRGMEIARSQMLRDMKKADVVIVNPEHYAVALKWSRADKSAPVCVAKGVDDRASVIRDLARENKVPIYSAPPTARALYATVEVGEQIPPSHYRAVAAAIRFADEMRQKRKRAPFGTY
ncbi:flagellar biosynthesis protein FlhB [Poseidonocella sp. HB161398]|uniref:EscU/YscU/HrcU family type III secretion system export apparatus switch protein n=1 Tax=Poseidonocella sp. HB161398 TaxID=2320855 RepID=UPI001108CA42|nr:flagellar type III secretion system protein FlhB [Poseidonocella sp. HB161398]